MLHVLHPSLLNIYSKLEKDCTSHEIRSLLEGIAYHIDAYISDDYLFSKLQLLFRCLTLPGYVKIQQFIDQRLAP